MKFSKVIDSFDKKVKYGFTEYEDGKGNKEGFMLFRFEESNISGLPIFYTEQKIHIDNKVKETIKRWLNMGEKKGDPNCHCEFCDFKNDHEGCLKWLKEEGEKTPILSTPKEIEEWLGDEKIKDSKPSCKICKKNLLESFNEHFPDANDGAWDIIKEAIKKAMPYTNGQAQREDGEKTVCGEETLKSQVHGYGRGETSHNSKMTDSKPSIDESIEGIYQFLLCELDGRLERIESGISILLKRGEKK